jgi:predicted MFS family arabinose efflux permease
MMALYHGGFNGGIAVALLAGGAITSRFGYPSLFMLSALVTASAGLWLRQEALEARG